MIFQNYGSHLANLVRFGVAAFPLKVHSLFNTRLAEDVVAPLNSHFESQAMQQADQIVKPYVCITRPAQHALESFLDSHDSTLSHLRTPQGLPL